MTLKQFFKVAGGALAAFLLYSTHLPFFVKWPLLLGSAGFGAALAFLPVNERPLENYLLAFFKAIFSPTIYLWQKGPANLDLLGTDFKDEEEEETPFTPVSKEPQLKEFLASLPSQATPKAPKNKPPAKTAPKTTLPTKVEKSNLPPVKPPKIDIHLKTPPPRPTVSGHFGQVPIPEPPKTPNLLVGMVLDRQGKIIENAIVEIQDQTGNTNRVMRTNRLGQFKTATPLANGEYLILVEKEGYHFDIIKIKTVGQVVLPLKITAK